MVAMRGNAPTTENRFPLDCRSLMSVLEVHVPCDLPDADLRAFVEKAVDAYLTDEIRARTTHEMTAPQALRSPWR